MSGVEARDASDLRKYRTEIPNIVLEMGLSPYALALYVHLKRTAGQEGSCWKSTRTLSSETGISGGKISDARSELEKHNLIEVKRPEVSGSRQTTVATIVDVWEDNFDYFSSRKRSPHEQSVHHTNAERSPHERRKEPYRKEHIEEVVVEANTLPEPEEPALDDVTARCLLLLKDVKGFPRNDATNALKLAEYRQSFPKADAEEVVTDFAAFIEEKPFKKGDNPRLKLRNFFKSSHKRATANSNVVPMRPKHDEERVDPGANTEAARARRTEGYEDLFA